MSNPLVSVIIPTYKRVNYLKLTLDSIINQTFQDFEIIVIDDGSPSDENLILCNNYKKVYYIKIENSGGPAKPRNIGIKEAKGKYIAFVDDDDLWLPSKLEKQIAILEQNLDFGLVHSCCEIIDEKGVAKNEIIGRPGTPDVKHGNVSLRMMGNWTIMSSTPLVRKEVIEKVGFFNEKMLPAGEDVEYWTRTSFCTKFYYIDKPLVQYRVHNNNISNQKTKYLQLPLYLKSVLENQLELKIIDKKQFQLLLNNLCKMQIRTFKNGFFKTLKNLFLIDSKWIIKPNNIKMMIFLFIKK
ncbi:glycosyltransferase family 2 protein [Flavobacterium sp.]|uniref:glycosyltransferase family 2 protein n=1 Tax=Flavobacterium sp. TaxID=239 RepID=UPI0037501A08